MIIFVDEVVVVVVETQLKIVGGGWRGRACKDIRHHCVHPAFLIRPVLPKYIHPHYVRPAFLIRPTRRIVYLQERI
jgi:hypothetical protein